MAYEQKDGDISIFANDKGGNDKRPDYRGDATIDGTKYRVSLWIREPTGGGKKYLSGKIERAESRPASQAAPLPAQLPVDGAIDQIPF